MIISKTPYRISFFGGGTDYPNWYNNNDGHVISSTINKNSFIIIKSLPSIFNYKIRLRYFFREEVKKISEIKHPSARECLKSLNIKENLDIVHFGDLPAATGIGSSSAFTVGFLNALHKFKKVNINKKKLFMKAIEIEQKKIKENVGSQDQIATAVGGLNSIKFSKKKISIKNLSLSDKNYELLNSSIYLVYTGRQRESKIITELLKKNVKTNEKYLYNIYKSTNDALLEFSKDKLDLKVIGEIMNYQWSLKKKLANNVSNKKIDEIMSIGRKLGVYGSKLIGAGGGGFILFLGKKENYKFLREKFNKNLIKIRLSNEGSSILEL